MPSDMDDEVDADLLEDEPDDELAGPGDDEAMLEEDLEEDLEDEGLSEGLDEDDDELGGASEGEDEDDEDLVVSPSGDTATESEEALGDDDEDELDDDDVEASLDVILKERLVVTEEEDDQEDDEEPADVEDRVDGTTRVLPKQPGEFVCQSCFLVKSETQLADSKKMLCRDCV